MSGLIEREGRTHKGADRKRSFTHRSFIREKWDIILFWVGLLAVAFGYGIAVERYGLFPHSAIHDGVEAMQDWRQNWRHYLQLRSKYLLPSTRTTGGVTRHDQAAAWPGYTFMTLYHDGRFRALLVDMDGRILHAWDVAFSDVWPEQHHLEVTPPDFDVVFHGAVLLPDGDVILNMEGVGAVRIDRCSRIVWRLAEMTHHSLDHLTNGETLITVDHKRYAADPHYPMLGPGPDGYFMENTILRLRQDGSIAWEISLLDVLYDSGWAALLLAGEKFIVRTEQPTHLNDVEVLRDEIARAFPLFQAGDVMLSIRNIHTILVVDERTWRIKWTMTGPFLYQHDPDFLPNGHILLFDNRRTGEIPRLGYSRILEIDPASREIVWSYEGTAEAPFYSDIRGMQQILPNGNVLVVEAQRGRVFEITRTPSAKIVWEYVNLARAGFVGLISGAERFAPGQLTFLGTKCGSTRMAGAREH